MTMFGSGGIRTARNTRTEMQIDLRKRRAWYSPDGDPPASDPPGDAPPAGDDGVPDWFKNDTKSAYAELKKVRDEAAKLRLAQKTAEDQKAADEAKKLADQGEYKTLFEKSEAARIVAEEKAANVAMNATRLKVAIANGLPVDAADRLIGTTEEELIADATRLKSMFGGQPQDQQETPPAPGAKGSTTTPIPGGKPAGETDEQKRARLYGGNNHNMFRPNPDGVKMNTRQE